MPSIAIFKANTRNTELLRDYLHDQLGTRQPPGFPWKTLIWLSVLIGAAGPVADLAAQWIVAPNRVGGIR